MQHKTMIDNNQIPTIGFGTDLIPDGDTVINAVTWAIESGYRLIDNADCYNNQRGVGIAIKNCIDSGIITRDDIFITSKVPDWKQGYDETIKCCKNSLQEMGLDFFDLYLVHSPMRGCGDKWWAYVNETYKALIDLQKEGKVKSIGVSNFAERHLFTLFNSYPEVRPVLNQIELHPQHQQKEIVDLCQKSYILCEAWGTLNQGRIFKNKTFDILANKYQKSISQIATRWSLQKGFIPLVRSINKKHIESNIQVFDFEVSADDMSLLDSLNGGEWSNMHDDKLFISSHSENSSKYKPYIYIYKLFGFIPFFKKREYNPNKTKYFLFGIPILKIIRK